MNDIYVGSIFHKWTVIDDTLVPTKNNYSKRVLCRCACGKERLVEVRSLRSGHSKSCGCRKQDNALLRLNELKGKKFGKLTIIDSSDKSKNYKWKCQCECGNTIFAGLHELESGRIKSCGCLKEDQKLERMQQIIGATFGRLTVLEILDFENRKVKCKCECGTETNVRYYDLLDEKTTSCGCIKSKGEEKLAGILTKYNLKFKKEVSFPDCKNINPLPFDFGIYRDDHLVGLIEYNGNIHYSSRGTGWNTPERLLSVQKNDYIKQLYCENKGIPLLIIPFTEYNNLENFLITSDFWKIIR